jgi:hypothetical protein
MVSHLKKGGQLCAYVWDYSGHYQPMRHFWNGAKEVNPTAEKYDAGTKFKLCAEENLSELFRSIGLQDIKFITIQQIAAYNDFDDYWNPIVTAQGSVTEFMSLLSEKEKQDLKEVLRRKLPIARNGDFKLIVTALAVKGVKP